MAGLALPVRARVRGELTDILSPQARVRQVYDGGRWCEGPAWDRRTRSLVFSDVRMNRIMRLEEGGAARAVRDPSGFANGNAFDAAGRLVTCEHLGRRVVRQETDGRITILADRFEGCRLNSPNDLAIARDGGIWFTDPTFGIEQPEEGRQAASEQHGRFVFRIDPDGSLAKVAGGFEQPNGIAFSPTSASCTSATPAARRGMTRAGARSARSTCGTAGASPANVSSRRCRAGFPMAWRSMPMAASMPRPTQARRSGRPRASRSA